MLIDQSRYEERSSTNMNTTRNPLRFSLSSHGGVGGGGGVGNGGGNIGDGGGSKWFALQTGSWQDSHCAL